MSGVAPHNRDLLVRDFLNSSSSWMLCVDSDMEFNSGHVEKLVQLNVDFSFGTYRTKNPNEVRLLRRGLLGSMPFYADKRVTVEEYERCAAGFVLLKRSVLERMWEAGKAAGESYKDGGGSELVALWQTAGFVEDERGRVQETDDYAFCRRWRALGGRIFTRSDVVIGHVGHHVYRV